MDRFSKTCLVLIVLLLAVIALRPVAAPQFVSAAALQATPAPRAAHWREYSYVGFGTGRLEDASASLSNASKQGFEVVGVTAYGQYNNQILFILAR